MRCACGCGREIDARSSRGEPRRFFSNACRQRSYRQNKRNDKRNAGNLCHPERILYFSGIDKISTAHALVKERAAGMMSQLLYRPALLDACKDIDLVMDSGAYTKTLGRQDIESYATLISKLGARCTWYANADVIGDQKKSNENYRFLLSLLPDSLHERILWIYQQSAPLSYLEEGLEQHRRIGVGGLVPLLGQKRRAIAIIGAIASRIARTDTFPHYFGVTSYEVIRLLRHYHERFSVDSTTWLIGGKYGALINVRGKQRNASAEGYDFETQDLIRQNVRVMRKWMEEEPIQKRDQGKPSQLTFLDLDVDVDDPPQPHPEEVA